jgi:glycosyltransferase involved in cell wall biosynthesis
LLDGRRIAVVVPAYNEAPRIAQVLLSMPAYVDDVVVVDDASRDGTAQVARLSGCRRVRVVEHDVNRGVGAALSTGYRIAFECGADVTAVMAGDGQMHPDDLEPLLRPVVHEQAEYAKGNRLRYPGAHRRMPPQRWVGNLLLSYATRAVTGLPVADSQCGYTAMSRAAHAVVPWHRVWDGYGYPNDLLGWLSQEGARVRDVVVRPVYADEISGIGMRHALVVIPWVLLRVLLRRLRAAGRSRADSACASGF